MKKLRLIIYFIIFVFIAIIYNPTPIYAVTAPTGTQWSSECYQTGDKASSRRAKFGAYVTSSNTTTQTTISVDIYIWTKYAITEKVNNNTCTWHNSVVDSFAVNISTTSSSGNGWAEANCVFVDSVSETFNGGTSDTTQSASLFCGPLFENRPPTWNLTGSFTYTVKSGHTHSYSAGSCISLKTCSCGETNGYGSHDYASEFTVDTAATCTEKGSKSKHCSLCDSKEDVTEIAALGHDMGSWSTTTAATCTAKGSKKRDCQRSGCSYSETADIAALGHNYDYDNWTYGASDGISNGLRYHKCTRCTAYTGLQYGCWVNAGTGISAVTGQNWYNAGDSVTLTATVKTGYTWSKYSCSGSSKCSSTSQTYTFTINAAHSFTATATPNQYTVTLNGNGATSTNHTTSVTATFDAAMPTITKPSRAYTVTYNANGGSCSTANATATYTFNGYYDATSGGTQYYTSAGASARTWDKTADTTLYAQWTSASVTLPTPTRTGYTFQGWYEDSSFTTKAGDAEANYTPTKAITLYAKWKANTYTVTLDANGATSTDHTTSVTATFDAAMPAITKPSRAYTVTYNANGGSCDTANATATYTFNGYSTSSDVQYYKADGSSARNYDIASATTLYAQWTSASVTLPTPTRTGYTFQGWYEDSSFTTKAGDAEANYTPTKAITLYAKWIPNTYHVDYYKGTTNNGGTTSASTHTYDADVTLHVNSFTGRGYTLAFNENKPKDDKGNVTAGTVTNLQSNKIGTLQFKDWYITDAHNNNNTNAEAGKNIGVKNYRNDVNGRATATAQWQSVTLENYSEPSLVGYKFNGYFTSATGGTKTTSITVDPATTAYSNTLYAQWTPITYTIRFNGNGNWNTSEGSYTQTITYDTHTALTANKFTRPNNTTYNDTLYKIGYEFVGWGTSPDQTTQTYTDGEIVNNLTATDGETIDLYAIWKKTVTLTIDFNGGKFNNSTDSEVLSYTMYNDELNHTFDIKDYYGTQKGTGYYSKGLNNNLTKTVDGIQYRFLGYSLDPDATVPDEQFDVYAVATRTEAYNIRDNTTLYAVWEPVIQMTASLSTSEGHSTTIQLDNAITIHNALGNFVIPSGTKNTALTNSVTATLDNKFTRINTVNSATVSYTVSAKGGSDIKFGMAVDSRILDIYTNGKDNTWYDELNQLTDFDYKIVDFTTVTDDFTIPKYLGTTNSYKTSNPNSADNSIVYGIKFTCTQPSYYYEKYWKTDETISIYGIIFLEPTEISDSEGEGDLPEHGDFNFQTILN